MGSGEELETGGRMTPKGSEKSMKLSQLWKKFVYRLKIVETAMMQEHILAWLTNRHSLGLRHRLWKAIKGPEWNEERRAQGSVGTRLPVKRLPHMEWTALDEGMVQDWDYLRTERMARRREASARRRRLALQRTGVM